MPGHIFHTVSEDGGVDGRPCAPRRWEKKARGCLAADELEAIVAQWVLTL